MSQAAAIAALVRSDNEPDSAFIEMSSLMSSPVKPIESRITCFTILAEVVAGATGSTAVNTTCAAMPRQVLEHRQNAALHQSGRESAGKRGHFGRIGAIGPIPNHRIGIRGRHVGNWRAVDVNPKLRQIIGNQPPAEPRCPTPSLGIAVEYRPT